MGVALVTWRKSLIHLLLDNVMLVLLDGVDVVGRREMTRACVTQHKKNDQGRSS